MGPLLASADGPAAVVDGDEAEYEQALQVDRRARCDHHSWLASTARWRSLRFMPGCRLLSSLLSSVHRYLLYAHAGHTLGWDSGERPAVPLDWRRDGDTGVPCRC